MKEERIICFCKKITEGDILRIASEGAETFEDAEKLLGCGTVCGACRTEIQKLLDMN